MIIFNDDECLKQKGYVILTFVYTYRSVCDCVSYSIYTVYIYIYIYIYTYYTQSQTAAEVLEAVYDE